MRGSYPGVLGPTTSAISTARSELLATAGADGDWQCVPCGLVSYCGGTDFPSGLAGASIFWDAGTASITLTSGATSVTGGTGVALIASASGVVLSARFRFRVSAAFRAAARRFLVCAAFSAASLRLLVSAAFLPASLRFLVIAAFFPAATRLGFLAIFVSLFFALDKPQRRRPPPGSQGNAGALLMDSSRSDYRALRQVFEKETSLSRLYFPGGDHAMGHLLGTAPRFVAFVGSKSPGVNLKICRSDICIRPIEEGG